MISIAVLLYRLQCHHHNHNPRYSRELYHQKTAKKLDEKIGTHADATGPVETEINPYNPGRVSGLVAGAFGEVSMQVRDHADLVACEFNAEHLALFDDAMNESK